MVSEEEPKETPKERKQRNAVAENGGSIESLFSPRFKSVAAMAGWDEEAILVAAVVEDTPVRESKQKKRSDLNFRTPPSSNSRRKRRAQRRSPISKPVILLNLDDQEESPEEEDSEKNKAEDKSVVNEEKKIEGNQSKEQKSDDSCSKNSVLPCMDKLREELSCAICLEICYEPSTTTCGHSFCKKCLIAAADKCGKRCPKCRQLISNGRSCTLNTILWNTIQLLFPQEVESRKSNGALNSPTTNHNTAQTRSSNRRRMISSQDHQNAASSLRVQRENLARLISSNSSRPSSAGSSVRRRAIASQDQDRALALRLEREENLARVVNRDSNVGARRRRGGVVLSENEENDDDARVALRLQREELRDAFRGTSERRTGGRSVSLARANLRAMASRAMNIRMRSNML